MSTASDVWFSKTGKAEHREFYASCQAASTAELRRWAVALWYDLRQRQLEDGMKATAAVWIGQTRCQPTKEEIEEYEQRVQDVIARSVVHRETDEEDEPPQAVVVQEEDEPAQDMVEEAEEEPKDEAPSIDLSDEDDLDF